MIKIERQPRGINKTVLTLGLSVFLVLIAGCAKERPKRPIIENDFRLPKKITSGHFLFLKTVKEVRSPGEEFEWMPPGFYVTNNDEVVQFVIKEQQIDVVRVEKPGDRRASVLQYDKEVEANPVLASFSGKNVDVLPKLNEDNQETHIEEETDTRRPWNEREYFTLNVADDRADLFASQTRLAHPEGGIEFDDESGSLNFTVSRHLKDNTYLKIQYSFLRLDASSSYEPRKYPRDLQVRFGYFKSTLNYADKYGQITYDSIEEYANRWDISKKVVYYFSKDFPKHLEDSAFKVFENWNESFRKATGRNDVLELRKNCGQDLGDLRYNMLVYDASERAGHHILGYGPSVSNPWTGEIVKADVYLYGGVLRSSVFRERIWEELLEKQLAGSGEEGGIGTTLFHSDFDGESGGNLLESGQSISGLPYFGYEFLDLRGNRLSQKLGGFRSLVDNIKSSLLPAFESANVRKKLDKKFMEVVKGYSLMDAVEDFRKQMRKRESWHTTKVDYHILGMIQDVKYSLKGGVSDEELEIRIFTPLLSHELGHNLGLRHNFYGSADKKHFSKDAKTSSVMDYAYLASHEGTGVGPYDDAAIRVLYNGSDEEVHNALSNNYFFCTDKDVGDTHNALCSPFDAGSTLSEAIGAQEKRYYANYFLNNLRRNRVYFNSDEWDYYLSVLGRLIPIRLAFDNATTILRAYSEYITNPADMEKLADLWSVARQRIEADKDSKASDVKEVPILVDTYIDNEGVENKSFRKERLFGKTKVRLVDVSKVKAVVEDAKTAQMVAFKVLKKIASFERDENDILHEDFGKTDPINGDFQMQGILYDRIASIMLMGLKTEDPVVQGKYLSMFASVPQKEGEEFFRSIISGTVSKRHSKAGVDLHEIFLWDINVREVALWLFVSKLSAFGEGAQSREMLAVENVRVDRDLISKGLENLSVMEIARVWKPVLEKSLNKEKSQKLDNTSKGEKADRNTPPAKALLRTNGATIFPAIAEYIDQLKGGGSETDNPFVVQENTHETSKNPLSSILDAIGILVQSKEEKKLTKGELMRLLVRSGVVTASEDIVFIPGFDKMPEELTEQNMVQLLEFFAVAQREHEKMVQISTKELREMVLIERQRKVLRFYDKILNSGVVPEELEGAMQQLALVARLARNEIKGSYVHLIGDQYLRAEVEPKGQVFKTISGVLVRDGINFIEDRKHVFESIGAMFFARLEEELKKPVEEQDIEAIAEISEGLKEVSQVVSELTKYLGQEKLYIMRLLPLFNEPDYQF